jgi:hypothetical protein
MKKSTLMVAALAFGVTTAFAQDLTSKKGEPILPEAGDYSIGIAADPFLQYFGNFIGGGGGNAAPGWNHLNGLNTIVGKMYVTPNMAYRGILRIGLNNNSMSVLVGKDGAPAPTFPNVPETVTDKMVSSSSFIGLGAGLEYRRGKTRLQGFYGGEAFLWTIGGSSKYTYGNEMTTTVTNPITNNFGTNIAPAYAIYGGRVLSEKDGRTIGIGVRGFVGAEYFIIPKLSVGGEFGWGIGYQRTGASTAELEAVSGGTKNTTEYTISDKSSDLILDTDRNGFGTGATQFLPSASLRLNFHF